MSNSLFRYSIIFFLVINPLKAQQDFWKQLTLSLNEYIYSIAFTPQREIFVGTSFGIHYSNDSGTTWVRRNWGLPDKPSVGVIASDGEGTMYSMVYSRQSFGLPLHEGIYRLRQNDTSWVEFNKAFPNKKVTALAVHPVRNTVFAGFAAGGLYRFLQNDTQWMPMDTLPPATHVSYLQIDTLYNALFIGSWSGIYRSLDDGLTVTFAGPSPSFIVNVMTMNVKGYVFVGSSNMGIIRSTNSGTNWTDINTLPNDSGAIAFAVNKNGKIFTVTNEGVFSSTDDGNTWVPLPWLNWISFLALDMDGYLYAGTQTGKIFKSNLSTTTAAQKGSVLPPQHYELQQNYPNPFNPSTKITYAVPAPTNITLSVYDLLGREVFRHVREHDGAGYFTVTFNASSFTAGVYFAHITSGNFTASKKMLLIK